MFDNIEHIKEALISHTPSPEGADRQSAVLIPIFITDNGCELLFCKRALSLNHQPGDVCFPGGGREGNETPLETALRETYEEIGVPAENIEILGPTDFIVAAYGAVIRPFVGLIKNTSMDSLKLNSDEVAEIFTVPLKFFMDTEPEAHYVEVKHETPDDFPFEYIIGGRNYPWGHGQVPEYFYFYENHIIWGFTARLVRNLCLIIKGEI